MDSLHAQSPLHELTEFTPGLRDVDLGRVVRSWELSEVCQITPEQRGMDIPTEIGLDLRVRGMRPTEMIQDHECTVDMIPIPTIGKSPEQDR